MDINLLESLKNPHLRELQRVFCGTCQILDLLQEWLLKDIKALVDISLALLPVSGLDLTLDRFKGQLSHLQGVEI